jgi:hypothetical protein
MNTDLALARRLHSALKEIFARQAGEGADLRDLRALRRVLALCEAGVEALDDAYCHQKLRLVGEYAAELLTHSDHAKWGRDSASGAEFLRQQVLNALELIASRLYSIETLRQHAGRAEEIPWKTRSGFARI